MIGRGHGGLNAGDLADLLERSRSKLCSAIRDDACWESVVSVDVIEVKLGSGQGVSCLGTGYKDNSFGAVVIYDNQNGVIAIGFGEVGNEVHIDVRERGSLAIGGDRHEWWCRRMMIDLHLLTDGTAVDVISNEFSHTGPVVFSSDVKECVVDAGMGIDWIVVVELKNKSFQFVTAGNIDAFLEV